MTLNSATLVQTTHQQLATQHCVISVCYNDCIFNFCLTSFRQTGWTPGELVFDSRQWLWLGFTFPSLSSPSGVWTHKLSSAIKEIRKCSWQLTTSILGLFLHFSKRPWDMVLHWPQEVLYVLRNYWDLCVTSWRERMLTITTFIL